MITVQKQKYVEVTQRPECNHGGNVVKIWTKWTDARDDLYIIQWKVLNLQTSRK